MEGQVAAKGNERPPDLAIGFAEFAYDVNFALCPRDTGNISRGKWDPVFPDEVILVL